eukprot:6198747-Pleurochrysis_carterae.AAC.2
MGAWTQCQEPQPASDTFQSPVSLQALLSFPACSHPRSRIYHGTSLFYGLRATAPCTYDIAALPNSKADCLAASGLRSSIFRGQHRTAPLLIPYVPWTDCNRRSNGATTSLGHHQTEATSNTRCLQGEPTAFPVSVC